MITLLDSLIENDSIKLKLEANTWEEAVALCIQPLIDSKAVESRYLDAIIERTKELGPFYILGYGLAMPHERPDKGALKNSFSLITLKEPVKFSDGQEIDILMGLAATSDEMHASQAIPQIVALFEDEGTFEVVRKLDKKEDIIKLIKNTLMGA